MAFRVYKPKNFVKIKAEQVVTETLQDIAGRLLGRVVREDVDGTPTTIGLDIPTLDGVKRFEIGTWIILDDSTNALSKMTDEEFQKTYEVARNTAGS